MALRENSRNSPDPHGDAPDRLALPKVQELNKRETDVTWH
jgi:hypothetical protein